MTNRTATVSGLLPVQVTETSLRTATLAGGVTLDDSTPAVAGAQTLSPSLLPSSVSFPAPTVSYVVTLVVGLLPSTNNFFAPAVLGVSSLAPGLLPSANQFFAPTVLGNSTLSPGLLPSETTFPAPTILGSTTLSPGLVPSTTSFPPATVLGNNELRPGLLPSANQVFVPVVQAAGAPLLVAPGLLPSENQFFVPEVVQQPGAEQTLAPELLPSENQFFPPTVGEPGIELPEPPVHWGGIGGPGAWPGQEPPSFLAAFAPGAHLVVALVLEPGKASGVVVAVPARQDAMPRVAVSVVDVPIPATVLGDNLGVTLVLDQGYAFGAKDWRRYNEELLLLVG